MRRFWKATRVFWTGWAYIFDYFADVKDHAWEVVWGATLIGIPFGIATLYWSPSWRTLGYVLATIVFLAGYQLWRDLFTRIQPKIEIAQIRWRDWIIERGDPRAYHRANAYEIEIVNRSEGTTVEGVSVQLSEVFPQMPAWEFLPIPLHLRHDDPIQPQDQKREFTLNPEEVRKIDFISALEGNTEFDVIHVQHGIHSSVPYTGNNRLQIRITAKDMPASFVWFKVWRDEEGKLQCEREV
ncbi:MAG: hypothetical protein ABSG10_10505 [Terracidiphilus sp.]|jgi:hypothetical protein